MRSEADFSVRNTLSLKGKKRFNTKIATWSSSCYDIKKNPHISSVLESGKMVRKEFKHLQLIANL
jgi:hypothetical protein